ncbi:hypothetical protein ACWEKJ_17585 [Amycolatopsis thermoflava]|uniref:hypothetical protein n=1 Tax=Amycolatopsis thermoflava TaxID=84480 RepID=UPI003F4A388A
MVAGVVRGALALVIAGVADRVHSLIAGSMRGVLAVGGCWRDAPRVGVRWLLV